ncbi:Uncharacterized protein CLAVI_000211 [Candidatus Clavichlamydia salmonicola]|uniref:ExbD/TolR family protein n=1 Tax=Candidatus Clavichlamydia salmonicola TaxID=469812 RepID=UPI001891B38B|nr:biopolymer transporter ExbD [Candidatus Clavichlamydia salmonicola]MBF5050600.1 Uncharacterized protein [Candidatus Clavichlamydia salmonicola]
MKYRFNSSYLHASAEEPSMNLTPLLDTVFVVLIAWMILAPFNNSETVSLANGGIPNSVGMEQTTTNLNLYIHENDSIMIGPKHVRKEELTDILSKIYQQAPYLNPILFQDQHSSFGIHQTLKTSLEKAGFKELTVILKADE